MDDGGGVGGSRPVVVDVDLGVVAVVAGVVGSGIVIGVVVDGGGGDGDVVDVAVFVVVVPFTGVVVDVVVVAGDVVVFARRG